MARDGAGVDVHLERVPLREEGLEPWEIMISESQERMVAVVAPGLLPAARAVCERWELHVAEIGEVTDTGSLRVFHAGELVGDVPAELLTERAPRYEVERRPRPPAPSPRAAGTRLERLRDPNVASKRWVYERYDQLVGSRTVRRPGFDGAVLRLTDEGLGIAVSLQGPQPGERDPRRAGSSAVLAAARNVACAGGEPIGLTDCLNFGNPEKPEIGWELAEAIDGIADAANALGIPVVSGNVSLYNETDGRAIPPTPIVGCVGLVRDIARVPGRWRAGDRVYALTADGLEEEAALVRWLWENAPTLTLAHDVGCGGADVALAEAALWSGVGLELEAELPPNIRAIVASAEQVTDCYLETLEQKPSQQVTDCYLGKVGGGSVLGVSLEELRLAWESVS
jgi:phosphoribosylformylglycinamidine synthase